MTKNYKQMYEEKMEALKLSILGSEINDELEMKSIANSNIEEITTAMTKIVGKPVWVDFNFRCGKILGILRFIAQNPQYRQELLEVTGLTQDYIDIYFKVCGNLPYLTNDNVLNPGRPMDVEKTKEFMKIVGAKLNFIIEDSDVSDITQERWDTMYQNAIAKLSKTINHNETYGETVPDTFDE